MLSESDSKPYTNFELCRGKNKGIGKNSTSKAKKFMMTKQNLKNKKSRKIYIL